MASTKRKRPTPKSTQKSSLLPGIDKVKSHEFPERIMIPSDATHVEKHILWLWALFKTSSDIRPSHALIAKSLGITHGMSNHAYSDIKAFVNKLQQCAMEELEKEEAKGAVKEKSASVDSHMEDELSELDITGDEDMNDEA